MATTKIQGNPANTVGQLPTVGTKAPDFTLTAQDLTDFHLADFKGKRVVLNIFPSLDTDVCAASVRRFNQEVSKLDDTIVVCASIDLPFAAARFCVANGIKNVTTGSGFRSDFGDTYGVKLTATPLCGLYARAIVIIDRDGTVIGTELVEELTDEPDYSMVIKLLS